MHNQWLLVLLVQLAAVGRASTPRDVLHEEPLTELAPHPSRLVPTLHCASLANQCMYRSLLCTWQRLPLTIRS